MLQGYLLLPDLTDRLAGKTVEAVLKSDETLVIRCEDGLEVHVNWQDDEGSAVKGEPKVVWSGKHVYADAAHIGMFNGVVGE